MRFFSSAVASLLLSISASEAKISRKELETRLRTGKVDHKTLLKKAIPYNQFLRRQEEADGDEVEWEGYEDDQFGNGYNDYDQDAYDYAEETYGDNQIDDSYPRVSVTADTGLRFDSCVKMRTQNYNLYMDNLINAAKNGRIQSSRSYVLFDLCQGSNCNGWNWFNKNANRYMIDLDTFIEAAIAYGPTEKERTCEACLTYADTCGKTVDYGDDGANRNRKLNGVQYQLFDRNTCSKCNDYDCWYDSEGDQQVDAESIEAWALEINECRESEAQWNGLSLYSGWMCSDDGTGIDVGVFIDPYCRMEHTSVAFSTIMEDNDYQYLYQSQEVIPLMFDATIDCLDTDNAQYVDYDTFMAVAGNEAEGQEDQAYYINDLCETIFNGDFAPRSLGNCGTPLNVTAAMMANANAAEYQQQGQGQNGGQNMYQYIQSQQMLYNTYGRDSGDWQVYDLSAQDVLDGAATCQAVAAKANGKATSSSGNGWWKGGGSLPWRNGSSAMSTPSARLTPLEIAWIVLFAVGATALFMHYTRKQIIKRKRRANENEKEVYQRTDDKGNPLIIS